MKKFKKINRDQLKKIQGGAILPDGDNCGTWCNDVWHPCTINHFACPPQ